MLSPITHPNITHTHTPHLLSPTTAFDSYPKYTTGRPTDRPSRQHAVLAMCILTTPNRRNSIFIYYQPNRPGQRTTETIRVAGADTEQQLSSGECSIASCRVHLAKKCVVLTQTECWGIPNRSWNKKCVVIRCRL